MNNEEVEIWGIHPKTEYFVSSFGRIRSRKFPDKFLIPGTVRGYKHFSLCGKMHKGHRLVWETFRGEIPYGMVINHLDGNKANNKLSNLQICSPKENSAHAFKNGLLNTNIGESCPRSILTERNVLNIYKMLSNNIPLSIIAKKYGVKKQAIHKIKLGIRWRHLFDKIKPVFKRRSFKKSNLTKEDIKNIKKLFKNNVSAKEIGQIYSVPTSLIYYFLSNKNPKKKSIMKIISELKPIKGEVWKKNKEIGLFVSNKGRCLTKTSKLLINRKKNRYTKICINNKSHLLHRIIWETFIGKIKNGLVINHKNGNITDNSIDNLEAVTHSENSKHAVRIGLNKPLTGDSHPLSKLKSFQIQKIRREIDSGEFSGVELSKKYKVSESTISLIKNKKRWKSILA